MSSSPPDRRLPLCFARTTLVTFAFVLLAFCTRISAAERPTASAPRMLERTRILASDEFEGRAPGTAGEVKTIAYLESEFKKLGLQPGNPNGTFVQDVPLLGITSQVTGAFSVNGRVTPLALVTEFIGLSRRLVPEVEVRDNDMVFVGYGVVAPEFGWDDYKDVDVRGKTVVMLVNDPPVVDPRTGKLDDAVFKGAAMSYYGRWTYKYEIASAKGAAACLIIHETGPAGYPFAVLAANSGREAFDLDTPDKNAGRVSFEGWLTVDAARRLLTAAGQDFDALKAAAAKREFRPVALRAQATLTAKNTTRAVASKNVLALLPGSDPARRTEYVVYSAHWDGYGRDARLSGDQILNGAADNAIAVAMLLELAQLNVALPPAERPRRSLLFFAPTAEEKNLLGSRYYVEHPLYPLEATLANINLEPLDANSAYAPTRDLEVVGGDTSTLADVAAAVARETGRTLRPDTEPEKGYFYRSDHFEFAKVGVPAFFVRSGLDFPNQPAAYGRQLRQAYLERDYHKVSDEVKPDWTLEGAAANTLFLYEVGRRVANAERWPEWKPGTEFKARREAQRRTK